MLRYCFAVLVILSLVFSSAFSEEVKKKGGDEPAQKDATKDEFKYEGVGKCVNCHKGHEEEGDGPYEVWLKSPHAKAYKALGSEKAKASGKKHGLEGSPQKSPECLKCHSSKRGVAKGKIDETAKFSTPVKKDGEEEMVENLGVGCEACHGPGSAYKKRGIMIDREEAMRNGLLDAKMRCVICHKSKNFNFEKSFKKIAHGPKIEGDEDK